MLTLYGTSKSRSARSLWALEELGLKYEHVPVEVAKAKSPEHLQRNPNGHVPVPVGPGLGAPVDWDWVSAHQTDQIVYE